MPGRWPGGVSLLSPYPDQRGSMSKPVSSTYRAPRKLAARSPLTTRGLAWARVITAPRPPRSLAARSGISGRPIRPGRPCSRDDVAPSLAGQRSDRPARVWLPARRLPRSLPPAAAARGPRPCCVLTQIMAAGIPALPACRPWRRRSCRAESGKAPPCMRWRGLARPRRTGWPAGWSSPAPRAARRGQVPARGAGLPAPPTFPGSPPGGARFQR